MKTTLRRKTVTAAALAALVSGIVAGAATPRSPTRSRIQPDADNSSYAYHLNPANEAYGGAYTLAMTPTSRTGVVSGTSALAWGPGTITIDQPCPVGYRASTREFIVRSSGGEFEAQAPLKLNPVPSVTKYGFHDGETITYGSPSRTSLGLT